MATPHIGAEKGQIAKTVLMPGDPLRAKFVAENFLENVQQYNQVRGMLGYTGTYKGKPVSVQGSGMGIPSIGIYAYELFHFYDVENIIRIGTAGSIQEDLEIGHIILAQGACTNSRFAEQYELNGTFAPIADYSLLKCAEQIACDKNMTHRVGNVISNDTFYDAGQPLDNFKKMGVLAVEMEAAGLYMTAAHAKKRALAILTVSDEIYTGKSTTAEIRQTAFTNMMEIALETAISPQF